MTINERTTGISPRLNDALKNFEKEWAAEEHIKRQMARDFLEKEMCARAGEYFGRFTPDSSYAKNSSLKAIATDIYAEVLQRIGFFYVPHDDPNSIIGIYNGQAVDMTTEIKELVSEILNELGRGTSKTSVEGILYHLGLRATVPKDLIYILKNFIVTRNNYILDGKGGKFLEVSYANITFFYNLFFKYLNPRPDSPNPRYAHLLEELKDWVERGEIKEDEDISDIEEEKILWDRLVSSLPFPVRLPVNYNPEAKAERWRQFVKEILDEKYHTTIKRFLGYVLYPDILGNLSSAALFIGDGANGKTVFIHTITTIVGRQNVSAVPMQKFRDRFSTKEIEHKLLNAAADLPQSALFDTGFVKMILGGDEIPLEGKFKKPYKGRITAKHIFAANELPPTKDKTLGFYRRFLIFIFPRQFLGERADPHLIEKLYAERDGIFNWMLEGYFELMKTHDFEYPHSLEEISDMYEYASDSLKRFVAVAVADPSEIDSKVYDGEIDPLLVNTSVQEIKASELYKLYSAYCREKGYTAKSSAVFYKNFPIEAAYVKKIRKSDGNYYSNIVILYKPPHEVAQKIVEETTEQSEMRRDLDEKRFILLKFEKRFKIPQDGDLREYSPGDVAELPAKIARKLIENEFAEEVIKNEGE